MRTIYLSVFASTLLIACGGNESVLDSPWVSAKGEYFGDQNQPTPRPLRPKIIANCFFGDISGNGRISVSCSTDLSLFSMLGSSFVFDPFQQRPQKKRSNLTATLYSAPGVQAASGTFGSSNELEWSIDTKTHTYPMLIAFSGSFQFSGADVPFHVARLIKNPMEESQSFELPLDTIVVRLRPANCDNDNAPTINLDYKVETTSLINDNKVFGHSVTKWGHQPPMCLAHISREQFLSCSGSTGVTLLKNIDRPIQFTAGGSIAFPGEYLISPDGSVSVNRNPSGQ